MATQDLGTSTQVTIIEPPGRWPTLNLRELWRYRRVCLVLAQRSIKVRYRSTALGIGWVLLQPLLFTAIFTIFFGLLHPTDNGGIPYPVFFLSGLIIWRVVTKIFSEGGSSIVANASIILRVYIPKTYLPFSVAIASLVDLLFLLIAFALLLLLYGIVPSADVIYTPLFVLVAYLMAVGVTFVVAALTAQYRDMEVLAPFINQIWFFLCPIMYSPSGIPEPWSFFYYLNAAAFSIDGMRWAWAGGPAPPTVAWVVSPIASVLVFTAGYLFFRRREPLMADPL